jgi:hypothetical protein
MSNELVERLREMVEEVFAEDIQLQARRLKVSVREIETPGRWFLRVRKAALLATLDSISQQKGTGNETDADGADAGRTS